SWRGLRRTIATGIIISVVATVTTAPLVAWAIGRVALVGPLTNLLADPIMGLLQPVLFVALCIPIPPIETLCADAAHALIALFDAIARAGAAVPGGAQAITPSTTSAILTGVAAVAALVACASRQPARAMLIAASAVAVLTDANLASTVLVARVGAIRFLFTGDAEAPEEEWLLAHDADALAADVLKVGHHGSRTSTTPRFLGAVRPRLALVSVGAHNAYGHPSPEVMQTLRDSGAQVLRTDRVGTIVVSTDGRHLEVEARNEKWSIPERVGP